MTTTPSVRLYTETTLSPEQQRILNSTPTRSRGEVAGAHRASAANTTVSNIRQKREVPAALTVPSGQPKHRHPLPGVVQAGTTIPHAVPAKSVWERG